MCEMMVILETPKLKKKVVKIDLSFQEESGLPLREVESMISVEQVNSLLL